MFTRPTRDRHEPSREAARHDDARLVRELMRGSEDAFAGIYDRHISIVFASAFRLTGDRSEAEELAQETFLALWRRPETFDPERASLATWLLAIVRNRAIDRMRAAARRPRALALSAFATDGTDDAEAADRVMSEQAVGVAHPEPGPELAVAERETRGAIEAALATLDAREREVIMLAYRDELSQSEIAERLEWPLGTVKSRTRRALGRLRSALEELDGRPGPEIARVVTRAQPCAAC